jgi:FkbM family methyltransferase
MPGKTGDGVRTFNDLEGFKIQVVRNDVKFFISSNVRYDSFWANQFQRDWEAGTFRIFDYYLKPDLTYIDFGAWVGPTLLYAASKSEHAYGLEPDKTAYTALSSNIALNDAYRERITIYQQALSPRTGPMRLYYGGDTGGDSMSSCIGTQSNSYIVEGLSVSDFFMNTRVELSKIGFVKIDIEGAEFDLIDPLIDFFAAHGLKPSLYISTHTPILYAHLKKENSTSWILRRILRNPLSRLALKSTVRNFSERFADYKFLYTSGGERIRNLSHWLKRKRCTEFLATDIPWKL